MRWACVSVPELPLQLLLRREPGWRGRPVAVVAEDRPQGVVLQVDECARRHRVLPGMRYAAALALAADLRAAVVAPAEVAAAADELHRRLLAFSPAVEPSEAEPGVFWLDAGGIDGVFPSSESWAEGLVAGLRAAGFAAGAAVGHSRFCTYALARSRRGALVVATPADERRRTDAVPLARLAVDPGLRDTLAVLGIDDVGGFRRLPAASIRARFGGEGQELHRRVSGRAEAAFAPRQPPPEIRTAVELDPEQAAIDRQGLLQLVEQALGRLLCDLAGRGHAIAALRLVLCFEKGGRAEVAVEPAQPTLHTARLLELLRLRLEPVRFDPLAFEGFELAADAVTAPRRQLDLFAEASRRDRAAGERALARLRAEFGDGAVARAELRDGHLPEARFRWRPCARLAAAAPAAPAEPVVVRRLLARPRPYGGAVAETGGGYVVAGGWWRQPIWREYRYLEGADGVLLWAFFDRRRGRWFVHGWL